MSEDLKDSDLADLPVSVVAELSRPAQMRAIEIMRLAGFRPRFRIAGKLVKLIGMSPNPLQ